jgi:hypothetical protein
MKLFCIELMFVMFFLSCSQSHRNEPISNFVLYIQPAVPIYDSTTCLIDSFNIDIWKYFEFKSDSGIRIFRSKNTTQKDFYTVDKNLIVGFNDTLLHYIELSNLKDEFYFNGFNHTYDGLRFAIYLKTIDNKELTINYDSPEILPTNLRKLNYYILGLTDSASIDIREFRLNNIVFRNTVKFYKKYPPPPPPEDFCVNK